MAKVKISDIFSSFQGEGIFIGRKQVFLRLFGCNLGCGFCDTPLEHFRSYSARGLLKRLDAFDGRCRWLSITGGEPLVQVGFLKDFLPLAKEKGWQIYLETNGTLPDALSQVIRHIDCVAMDLKLPSSTGKNQFWNKHREFLKISLSKTTFVKVVICLSTVSKDLRKAAGLVGQMCPDMPFVLVPNWFQLGYKLLKKIEGFQKMLSDSLSDVRIVPQVHKLLGIK
jgi:organic radical activating enzyme